MFAVENMLYVINNIVKTNFLYNILFIYLYIIIIYMNNTTHMLPSCIHILRSFFSFPLIESFPFFLLFPSN